MKALIVIDYTFDFVADAGKLTCGAPGQVIDHYIAQTTREFVEAGEYVVLAVDVHDEGDAYHPETKLFPPHNIRHTPGRHLYGEVGEYCEPVLENGLPNLVWMDKTRYSSFTGTDLDMQLRARGIQEIHLAGVCTDICVLHTAVDAYNRGYDIVVHERGVASFNPAGHDWALGHFTSCIGATVVK